MQKQGKLIHTTAPNKIDEWSYCYQKEKNKFIQTKSLVCYQKSRKVVQRNRLSVINYLYVKTTAFTIRPKGKLFQARKTRRKQRDMLRKKHGQTEKFTKKKR